MHQPERSRIAVARQSAALPLAAVILANVALAFGPWFVRLTDTGPVAAGFWRLTLATPFLAGMALAAGARACSGGRLYLYALGAAGEPGVRRILGRLQDEIERDMKLMGITRLDQLNRSTLRSRRGYVENI